jgi:ribonuclease HII
MGYVLGIDESGKGNILGNLFVAGTIVSDTTDLTRWQDVKDSKKYKNEIKLMDVCKKYQSVVYSVIKQIEPSTIDKYVNGSSTTLNTLLLQTMVSICVESLNRYDITKIIVDSPTSNCSGWARDMRSRIRADLDNPFVSFEMVCQNHADSNHKIVALASVFAKYHWRNHMVELCKHLHAQTGLLIKNGIVNEPVVLEYISRYPNSKYIRTSWKI